MVIALGEVAYIPSDVIQTLETPLLSMPVGLVVVVLT